MEREIVTSSIVFPEAGFYSQGIRAGELVFVAGQIAIDPDTGRLVTGGIAAQTRQVLKNVQAVLEAGGSSLRHIVKITTYLANIDDFEKYDGAFGEFFGEVPPPARITVGAQIAPARTKQGELISGLLLEMDAIGVVPG